MSKQIQAVLLVGVLSTAVWGIGPWLEQYIPQPIHSATVGHAIAGMLLSGALFVAFLTIEIHWRHITKSKTPT